MYKSFLLMLLLVGLYFQVQAQEPPTYTQPSQLAKVFQRIGTTDIEIIYHAPLAKGRTVFGELVPYNDSMHGKPHPWRAGANENTVLKFAHDVMINGTPLKAGTYGLHIFVSENTWELTFSNDYKAWGSFTYTPNQDALRVDVKPFKIDYEDWLSYRFLNPKGNSVTIELHWASQAIQFEVSTNVHANIVADVAKMKNPNSSALLDAAKSTLRLAPQAIDKAMTLADASVQITANLNNRMYKADLLDKAGKAVEAGVLRAKAIEEANANELFSMAMSYNNKGEDTEALNMLARNLKENPKHWMTYLGYGHYYRTHEDLRALEYHKKALELAPEAAKGFANYQYGYAKKALGVK